MTRMVIGIAIALNFLIVGSATAGADPSAFSGLGCKCPGSALVGSTTSKQEIGRGIGDGLTRMVAGAPHSAQPLP